MKLISKHTLSPFDWFLIIGSVLFYFLHWWLVKAGYSGNGVKFSLLGAFAGIAGLIGNVLCAKRNITNYFFGIANVSLYAWIAWQNKIYGDVALNALYYLPMQFIGFYSWYHIWSVNQKKIAQSGTNGTLETKSEIKESEDETAVQSKTLRTKQRVVIGILLSFAIVAVALILKHFTDDPQPFKDSATTVISIVAMALMVGAYKEQWWLWIAVNIISTIMWIYAYKSGGDSSGEMIIKWFFNLANSINGFIVWSRAAKREKIIQKSI